MLLVTSDTSLRYNREVDDVHIIEEADLSEALGIAMHLVEFDDGSSRSETILQSEYSMAHESSRDIFTSIFCQFDHVGSPSASERESKYC